MMSQSPQRNILEELYRNNEFDMYQVGRNTFSNQNSANVQRIKSFTIQTDPFITDMSMSEQSNEWERSLFSQTDRESENTSERSSQIQQSSNHSQAEQSGYIQEEEQSQQSEEESDDEEEEEESEEVIIKNKKYRNTD